MEKNRLLIISFDAVSSGVWEHTLARRPYPNPDSALDPVQHKAPGLAQYPAPALYPAPAHRSDSAPHSEQHSDPALHRATAPYPNIAAFAESAETTLGVDSVFITNTYPIHCSIVTGRDPCEHGVSNNVAPFPEPHPPWINRASAIKARTLWQAAAGSGLRVAAVLWPCTGGSPFIRYNIPEIYPMPGQNQIIANLKAGSKLLQLQMLLRYRKLLAGVAQPALDDFVTSCAVDILRRKRPDLTFVHLTCCDSFGHIYGPDQNALKPAFEALDRNLGRLLEAAGDDAAIIVLSDHGCLEVHTELTPNDVLVDMGLLNNTPPAPSASSAERASSAPSAAPFAPPAAPAQSAPPAEPGRSNNARPGLGPRPYEPGASGCFIECNGGSAFFHAGTLEEEVVEHVRKKISGLEGFGRFLTKDEMLSSGNAKQAFGFGMKPGFSTAAVPTGHKGDHGYPKDMPDYEVFYAVRGEGFAPGKLNRGGSLLDIAPVAAAILGIEW